MFFEFRLPYRVNHILDNTLPKLGLRERVIRTDGLKIRIRRNTWDYRIAEDVLVDKEYTEGGFEPAGDETVIDIGANIGAFTLHSAKRCRRVIAYEPGSNEFELLTQNIELNGFDNVSAVRAAVGGSRGETVLFHGKDSVLNTIHEDRAPGGTESEKVQCVTLEDIFRAHNLDHCDLLKLDCEGAEYDILYSADVSCLQKVSRITMEYHVAPGEDKRRKADSLGTYLESIGFKVVRYIDFVDHDCGMMRLTQRSMARG